MKKPITIYLYDHLAGAKFALDLIKTLEQRYRGGPLGEFATNLYSEISSDKEVLHELAEVFGSASDPLKDGAAWLGEKGSS